MIKGISIVTLAIVAGISAGSSLAYGATTCTFTTIGNTMILDEDCYTDSTISIPNGMTLDGDSHTITAIDPPTDHFRGAIIENAGTTAHVTNIVLETNLANACDGGADRLRGIMFDGASGSITHNTILSLNQGASGCQEGNAIEVRNAPFDGTHPDTQYVDISHNQLLDWQKTGIVANGDVDISITHNQIGESATQDNLAANSIQIGFGGTGTVKQNQVAGNQWKGTSDFAATAILVYLADDVELSKNIIRGNSDIGIYFFGDNGSLENNKVFDEGQDHPNSDYDIGVGNWGVNNEAKNNKVRGFDEPYSGVTGGKNKAIPGPQHGNDFFMP